MSLQKITRFNVLLIFLCFHFIALSPLAAREVKPAELAEIKNLISSLPAHQRKIVQSNFELGNLTTPDEVRAAVEELAGAKPMAITVRPGKALTVTGSLESGSLTFHIGNLLFRPCDSRGSLITLRPSSVTGTEADEEGFIVPVIRLVFKAPEGVTPDLSVSLEDRTKLPATSLVQIADDGVKLLRSRRVSLISGECYRVDCVGSEGNNQILCLTIYPLVHESGQACYINTLINVTLGQDMTGPDRARSFVGLDSAADEISPSRRFETLFVCSKQFARAAVKLATWKSMTGRPSRVLVVPNEYTPTGLSEGTDNLNMFREFLKPLTTSRRFRPFKPRFIVFMGDDRFIDSTTSTIAYYHDYDDPTNPDSLGFSSSVTVESDLLTLVDGRDIPAIMASRIAVAPEEAMNYVDRVISWEKGWKNFPEARGVLVSGSEETADPSNPFYNMAIDYWLKSLGANGIQLSTLYNTNGVGNAQIVDEAGWEQYQKPPLSEIVIRGTDENGIEYVAMPNRPDFHFYRRGTYSDYPDLFEAIGQGALFMMYRGHGSPDSINFRSGIFGSDIHRLINGRTPFVFSISCLTSCWFTPNRTNSEVCLGEEAITGDQGCICYLGAGDPAPRIADTEFAISLAQELVHGENETFGELIRNAKFRFGKKYGFNSSSISNAMVHLFNVLGDGTALLRTKAPEKLIIEASRTEEGVKVSVKDSKGNPVSGVRVTLWDPKLSVLLKVTTDMLFTPPTEQKPEDFFPENGSFYNSAVTDDSGTLIFQGSVPQGAQITAISKGHFAASAALK